MLMLMYDIFADPVYLCSPPGVVDAELQEYENMESMPRPEEEREIEIEKNKRLQAQLKVGTHTGL